MHFFQRGMNLVWPLGPDAAAAAFGQFLKITAPDGDGSPYGLVAMNRRSSVFRADSRVMALLMVTRTERPGVRFKGIQTSPMVEGRGI